MQLSKKFFSKLHLFRLISCVGFIPNPTQNSSYFHLLNSFPSNKHRSCKDQDLCHSFHFIATLDVATDLTAPDNFLSELIPLDESLPSLSGMGIGCVRARVFPCEPIFRKPAGEVYLCSNWSDVYLILRLAPIWLELQSWLNRYMFTIGGNVIDFNFFCT